MRWISGLVGAAALARLRRPEPRIDPHERHWNAEEAAFRKAFAGPSRNGTASPDAIGSDFLRSRPREVTSSSRGGT